MMKVTKFLHCWNRRTKSVVQNIQFINYKKIYNKKSGNALWMIWIFISSSNKNDYPHFRYSMTIWKIRNWCFPYMHLSHPTKQDRCVFYRNFPNIVKYNIMRTINIRRQWISSQILLATGLESKDKLAYMTYKYFQSPDQTKHFSDKVNCLN